MMKLAHLTYVAALGMLVGLVADEASDALASWAASALKGLVDWAAGIPCSASLAAWVQAIGAIAAIIGSAAIARRGEEVRRGEQDLQAAALAGALLPVLQPLDDRLRHFAPATHLAASVRAQSGYEAAERLLKLPVPQALNDEIKNLYLLYGHGGEEIVQMWALLHEYNGSIFSCLNCLPPATGTQIEGVLGPRRKEVERLLRTARRKMERLPKQAQA